MNEGTQRICRVCRVTKPTDAFHRRGDGGKYYTRCRSCDRVVQSKRYHSLSPEEKYTRNTSSGLRLKRYRLTLDSYHAMAERQDFLCAICHIEPIRKKRLGSVDGFAIDHCHSSGKVRGLLCERCNKGIGFLREDPHVARSAAVYLEGAR